MMQASSHQAGQGGMINNAPQLAWNGMPTPAIGNRGKPWHSKADTELRHGMLLHIMKVFYRPGSESNLPNMLRLLEEALYYEAASREEYADLKTLQQRIQALILRMRMKHGSTQHILHTSSAFSKNTEVSSVGYSSRVFNAGSSTMIPTPGIGSSISDMGGEGFVVNAGGNRSTVACELNSMNHMNIMASCQGLNTTIFSTDGVISLEKPGTEIGQTSQRTQLTSSSPSAGLSVQNVRGSSFNQMKQNLIAIASGDSQMHGNLNDKRNTNACFRDLMHNSTQFLDPSGYLSSAQCSTLQSQKPISHLNSQMQYGFSDGFSRNVADLDLSGSLHNIVLPARPTCPPDASSLASLSASSFPFPSSLWQQHDSLSQKHYSQSLQNQFSHELLQKDDVKQGISVSMNMQQHQLPSRSMISANDVGPLNGGFTESPYNSLPSQDTVEKLVHTQYQPQMMEVSAPLLQKAQVGKHCKEQHHKQPVYLQIASQENQIPDERLEQNEQVCQATAHSALSISNDAGQPEVVSNNESLGARQINLEPSISRTRNFQKQRLWLLYLRHASRCTLQEGECIGQYCSKGRQLWAHICSCHDRSCSYTYCVASKTLLIHHQRCRNVVCPVCAPVRNVLSRYKMQRLHSQVSQGQVASSVTTVMAEGAAHKAKRVKIEVSASSAMHLQENSQQSMLTVEGEQQASHYSVPPVQQHQQLELLMSHQNSIEARNSNSPDACRSGQSSFKESSSAALLSIDLQLQDQAEQKLSSKLANYREVKFQIHTKEAVSKTNSNLNTLQSKSESSLQAKQESVASVSISTSDISPITSTKTAKIKVPGISYIEFLDVDIIKQHIYSLRQWIGQSKAKAEKNQALGQQMVPDACPACAVEKIYFEPSPIYCTSCGVRVKRNAVYYTAGSGDTRLYYCIPCYNNQTDIIKAGALTYKKSLLEKRKNDEQQEEAWVECDKCKKWQHQICALFNVRINDCDRAEYTCPDCCISEMERGERVPYSQDTVLGAKDLPRTFLSDYIEERLTLKLDQERTERAKAFGKSPNEVPGAEGLVVRVVSSVDKKLEVKKQFFELFCEQGYPAEFPYKSKMLLLFQKIEGVEVCLFGMYVQEFGANCSQPNQRRVYLAYLDSVKYFRPDIKTVNGEALRTFVYHEILIGYLDYCKKRGFTSCYIWACPPLKGEDYILYCHPEIQKTPKSDKLREWYLTMIRKAKKESIVIANRNIHDYFFSALGECKAKVTAAHLPYFDGDYLPGAAEDIIAQIQEEEEGKSQKRGKSKKLSTKRFGKGFPEDGLSSKECKDRHLMQKLGDSIHAMREDFIMVHLQHTCTHCRGFVISGNRWVCQKCSNDFQLCDICYVEERKLTEEERHPAGKKEMHALVQIEVDGVPADTQDRDEAIESEIFDTRHAFLSLCQGNHYQYDTLRRAKHSSMMVLYHLHNPNAPPFTTSCNVCNRELEGGQGWKCETCCDYDVCTACFSLPEVQKHPHKLVQHSSAPGCTLQNKESRQQQLSQLRKMLELLVHASQCYQSTCQHPKCRSMKELFRHGNQCKIRLQKGCGICKRMWYLLRAHARSCIDRACHVPRCCDLKDLSRRYQLQQESRRRAAVNEMMRQRAAEAAEESG